MDGETEPRENDFGKSGTVGCNGRTACRQHHAAEFDALQLRTVIAEPAVGVPERAIDNDFLQTRNVLEHPVRQELDVVQMQRAQRAAIAETIPPQLCHHFGKLHLRKAVAMVESPVHHHHVLGETDATQRGVLESPHAEGIHLPGQFYLL